MNSTGTARELHMNFTRTSHEQHVNSTGTARERHLKPVSTANDTSRELHESNTLRVISLKKNNLLHVLDPEEEEDYKNYLAYLRKDQPGSEVNVNTSREELLTAEQAGKLLNKTARQVYTYIRQGKLREVKVTVKGRERIRVPLADVEALREELGISHEVHVNSTGSSHEPAREVYEPEIVEPTPEPPRQQQQIIPVVDVLQVAQLKNEINELRQRQETQEQKYLKVVEKLYDKIDKLSEGQAASTKELREEFSAKLEAETEKLVKNQVTSSKEIKEWATIEIDKATKKDRRWWRFWG